LFTLNQKLSLAENVMLWADQSLLMVSVATFLFAAVSGQIMPNVGASPQEASRNVMVQKKTA